MNMRPFYSRRGNKSDRDEQRLLKSTERVDKAPVYILPAMVCTDSPTRQTRGCRSRQFGSAPS